MFQLKTNALALMGAASFCGPRRRTGKDIADSRKELLLLTIINTTQLKIKI